MTGSIYLIGFMGCGKSTVGQALAKLLNRTFVDMDVELEKRFGMTIREIFAQHGEYEFRDAESRLLRSLAQKKALVVATGGGIVERMENMDVMGQSGVPVYLSVTFKECVQRLGREEREKRPLLADMRKAEQLFKVRQSLYARVGAEASVDGMSPESAARAVLNVFLEPYRLEVDHGGRECPVIGCFNGEVELAEALNGRRIALLTDGNVACLHLERFRPLPEGSIEMVVPPGEGSKSLRTAGRIYDRLLEARFDRGDTLVAIGGGVITDLGAFVASTYKRGMPFILVSTTLLGCVDAAIGGKAAVNHGTAKNCVGAFSVPNQVILDFSAFNTLTTRHRLDGLTEAYKTGLIASDCLTDILEEHLNPLVAGDALGLAHAAFFSAQVKASVVSADFTEQGLRRILNFGHTYGHGLEGASGFRIGHGPATAMGMIVATEMSFDRGLISQDERDGIQPVLQSLIPKSPNLPVLEDIQAVMLQDKKIKQGLMVFVLLHGVGDAVCVDDVDFEEVRRGDQTLRAFLSERGN